MFEELTLVICELGTTLKDVHVVMAYWVGS